MAQKIIWAPKNGEQLEEMGRILRRHNAELEQKSPDNESLPMAIGIISTECESALRAIGCTVYDDPYVDPRA